MNTAVLAVALAALQGCALTVSDPRARAPIEGFVQSGGGAEYASGAQAWAAIAAGRRVDVAARDTRDRRHRAAVPGLDTYGFYRQSMMRVRWLRAQDESRFRQRVLSVQNDEDFEIAFWNVYCQATRLAGFFDGAPAVADAGSIQAAPAHPNPGSP
ncbi:MAG: hypothetical protein ACYC5S_07990 [Thiobacillus sp.]